MSNISKDHPSIRLHAPPGGHSNNIFGTSEFEQSAVNKKNNMKSDIFGSNKDNEPAPSTKQSRNTGNNIFGTDPEETHTKGGTIAGQFKQTQMKSNIFGTDEPTTTRHVSDKNKSNIFGIGDNEQTKHATAPRHGLRVGYNPISGESYAPKENVNAKDKQPDSTVKPAETGNGHVQAEPADSTQAVPVDNAQVASTNSTENGNTQATSAKTNENDTVSKAADKSDNTANGNNAQKNVHTSVRVCHPPGGKSNGPLW